MNTERSNIALNDAALESVSGGFNLYDSICNIGDSVETSFQKGGEVGFTFGFVGAFAGGIAGAIVGTVSGVKDEVGKGVGEAVDVVRGAMR
ncbi:hypothetical protein DK26_11610 [Bosea sp. WAO]|uniref:hypothetical protein n=1 Tax=Bosea sp. WAO TaxID=406341 RepID=UPI00074797CC|nr:hypothetical protein [Bosea sp. WAO]KUL95713.1 hypothetical protein DK26_11610 [Bosea sp. WAO]